MICGGRIYKGQDNYIELYVPDASGITGIEIYTGGELKITPEEYEIVDDNTIGINLTAEDLDPLEDGVIYYTVEYEDGGMGTNSNYYLKTPVGYTASTLDELIEEAYDEGYADGQEDCTGGTCEGVYESGYTDGYESGYTEGYESGSTSGYEEGYASGSTAGYNSGHTDGEAEQKAKLTSTSITENNIYTRDDGWNYVTVNVPQTGHTDEELHEAYDSGFTHGEAAQKAKLVSTAFTENGLHFREDGFSTVSVNVPQTGYTPEQMEEAYQSGYTSGSTDGYASGSTDGYNSGYTEGETAQKAKMVATAITQNGMYAREDGFLSVSVNVPQTGYTQQDLDNAYASGKTDGYDSGYTEGYNGGYTDGYNQGTADGYQTGYAEGEEAGYQTGYSAGEEAGYQSGYTDGYQSGYTRGTGEGYQSGYTEGEAAGYQSGYTSGTTDGYNSGYTSGTTDGYNSGYTQGYNSGSTDGYQSGYTDGYDVGIDDCITKLIVTPQSFPTCPSSGGTRTIQIESNQNWSIEGTSWLTPSVLTGSGDASVDITISANSVQSGRTGSVNVIPESGNSVSVTISQNGASGSYFRVLPEETGEGDYLYFGFDGGTSILTIDTDENTPWCIEFDPIAHGSPAGESHNSHMAMSTTAGTGYQQIEVTVDGVGCDTSVMAGIYWETGGTAYGQFQYSVTVWENRTTPGTYSDDYIERTPIQTTWLDGYPAHSVVIYEGETTAGPIYPKSGGTYTLAVANEYGPDEYQGVWKFDNLIGTATYSYSTQDFGGWTHYFDYTVPANSGSAINRNAYVVAKPSNSPCETTYSEQDSFPEQQEGV